MTRGEIKQANWILRLYHCWCSWCIRCWFLDFGNYFWCEFKSFGPSREIDKNEKILIKLKNKYIGSFPFFFNSKKFFFFAVVAIQNDCWLFHKKGYQKNTDLLLVGLKELISLVNLIAHTSDTISMVQQGPDCKFRKASTNQNYICAQIIDFHWLNHKRNEFFVHHIICGIAIYVTMKERAIELYVRMSRWRFNPTYATANRKSKNYEP